MGPSRSGSDRGNGRRSSSGWKPRSARSGGASSLPRTAAGGIGDEAGDDWEYVAGTELIGYTAWTREAGRQTGSADFVHIVNVGSVSGDVPEDGISIDVATKWAVQGFSESLRKEVNKLGIKVSSMEPGAVGTDLQSEKETHEAKARRGEMLGAEDVAACVVYGLAQPRRCDVVAVSIRTHAQAI